MASGIDPYAYLVRVSEQLEQITDPAVLETVLDEVEYLYEVIPPDFQDLADQIVAQLRDRLDKLR